MLSTRQNSYVIVLTNLVRNIVSLKIISQNNDVRVLPWTMYWLVITVITKLIKFTKKLDGHILNWLTFAFAFTLFYDVNRRIGPGAYVSGWLPNRVSRGEGARRSACAPCYPRRVRLLAGPTAPRSRESVERDWCAIITALKGWLSRVF